MPADPRPRRSALYMPGSNPRALEKARDLPCDVIIMDLEDAVAPDAKEAAREAVAAALLTGGYGGRELVLRVNGLDTAWGYADLAFAAGQPVHAVLLPKVESADAVRRADAVLTAHGAPDELALWCMMETPRGVLAATGIAGASPRVAGFVMGTSDLAKDLHCLHTPDRLPFVTALGLCLLAARAHGLAILDGVYLDLGDDEGFAASCRQGVEFGFDGKSLIHPKTIATANAAFAPSEAAIAWARRITAAHAAAEAEGKGVLLVDGKLVEALHVAEAKRLVALAERIQALHGSA
ncbi:CoA ester lyase [Thalassobaculum fulvum]|uniref:CoA ester lyase n=1 Tax=Thalassobaculum fulvum TaxID=1633335 RepID=A0A918XNT5_9PROT|nr:CoA ester lyase [Thalassobaculum fulvum]GHD40192.1 CoA ester lyase [Thalassobaculum fulvum]